MLTKSIIKLIFGLLISLQATLLQAETNPDVHILSLRFENQHAILTQADNTILFNLSITDLDGVVINQPDIHTLFIDFQNQAVIPLPILYRGNLTGETTLIIQRAKFSKIRHFITGSHSGELHLDDDNIADLRYQGIASVELQESYPFQLIIKIKGNPDVVVENTDQLGGKRIRNVGLIGGSDTVFTSHAEQPVFVSIMTLDDQPKENN